MTIQPFPLHDKWLLAEGVSLLERGITGSRDQPASRKVARNFWSEGGSWVQQWALGKKFDSEEDAIAFLYEHRAEMESAQGLG